MAGNFLGSESGETAGPAHRIRVRSGIQEKSEQKSGVREGSGGRAVVAGQWWQGRCVI